MKRTKKFLSKMERYKIAVGKFNRAKTKFYQYILLHDDTFKKVSEMEQEVDLAIKNMEPEEEIELKEKAFDHSWEIHNAHKRAMRAEMMGKRRVL